MEQSYIQNYGQYNTIVDGNVIENTKWNAVYNETGLDLEAKRNNESIYINLSKDELIKLFEVPASNKSIHERLEDDLYSNDEQLLIKPIVIEEINNKKKENIQKKIQKNIKHIQNMILKNIQNTIQKNIQKNIKHIIQQIIQKNIIQKHLII